MHNRNPQWCGVCSVWSKSPSTHNRGKRHNILLAIINRRIEELRINSGSTKVSAPSIVADGSQQDERDQTKQH